MGHPEEEVRSFPEIELIRLLMDGSRTQISHEELASSERVAPFLLDDAENADRSLRQVVLATAIFMFSLGRYLYGSTFREYKMLDQPSDRTVRRLMQTALDKMERL